MTSTCFLFSWSSEIICNFGYDKYMLFCCPSVLKRPQGVSQVAYWYEWCRICQRLSLLWCFYIFFLLLSSFMFFLNILFFKPDATCLKAVLLQYPLSGGNCLNKDLIHLYRTINLIYYFNSFFFYPVFSWPITQTYYYWSTLFNGSQKY